MDLRQALQPNTLKSCEKNVNADVFYVPPTCENAILPERISCLSDRIGGAMDVRKSLLRKRSFIESKRIQSAHGWVIDPEHAGLHAFLPTQPALSFEL